ncbi:MAG: glycine cleavage system aminomethyltransferase GcvT [Thermoplasmataceae archaeon]
MKTELYDEHVKLGGNIIDFHGWDMPLYYSSIITEHNYVRKSAGVFDVSHMGDILISGKDAVDFLEYIIPSNISSIEVGKCIYTAFLNNDGNIIDDTIIYRINNNTFLSVPNASTTEKIYDWMKLNSKGYDVNIDNISNKLSCIALQGPLSEDIMKKLNMKFQEPFTFSGTIDTMIISGTGYTGEKGIEIIINNNKVKKVWSKIIQELMLVGGGPCGLGSRDTLRMEKGMLLSGQDFNNNRDPIECAISFIMTNTKKYIGKEMIERRDHKIIFRGFVIGDKGIPRNGNIIFDNNLIEIGEVTSGTISPTLNKGISLGFVDKSKVKVGNEVLIQIRDKKHLAIVSRAKIVP